MTECIVDCDRGVTLVGNGDVTAADLSSALARAPVLVAADGGADAALAHGHRPVAVIGDLDSVGAAARATLPASSFHHIAEQDSTDFDKALRSIAAPFVLAVGFTGARLDHALAVLNVLVRHAGRPCLVLGPLDVCFVSPRSLDLVLPVGTRFSLFPMGEVSGTSAGLRWPIDRIGFAPDGRSGTSNETVAEAVTLRLDAERMLVILPAACLDAALTALLRQSRGA